MCKGNLFFLTAKGNVYIHTGKRPVLCGELILILKNMVDRPEYSSILARQINLLFSYIASLSFSFPLLIMPLTELRVTFSFFAVSSEEKPSR